MGDAIAVVYAESKEEAEKAAGLIKVSYQELPGVFSIEEALQEGAPLINGEKNICKHLQYQIGDINRVKLESNIVVTGHFTTPFIEHCLS